MGETLHEFLNSGVNPNDVYTWLDDHPDKATYDLFSSGKVKGVFQLETPLGRQSCRDMKPENLGHAAGLVSVLRPGCLQCKDDEGISMTKHYMRRKNGLEEVKYYHPALEPILKDTFGILVYQESMMRICQDIAGFDLAEVDRARKGVGKKDAKELSEIMSLFVEKATKKAVVTREEAQQIADWIKESARYAFNASHSYSYAKVAELCAFVKANYSRVFLKNWLKFAENRPDSKEYAAALVKDAQWFSIEICTPSLLKSHDHFEIVDGKIFWGLYDIAGIGYSHLDKLRKSIASIEERTGKALADTSWYEFLILNDVGSSIVEKLIGAGALDFYKAGRRRMLHELKNYKRENQKQNGLTPTEQAWCAAHYHDYTSLIDLLKAGAKPKKEGGACHTKNRVPEIESIISVLENPPSSLIDSADFIISKEEELLGVSVTCSRLDKFDTSYINTDLKKFTQGRNLPNHLFLAVEVVALRRFKCRNDTIMGFLTLEDKTCQLDDAVIFSDALEEYGDYIYEGATILIEAEKDKRKGSLVVKRAYPLEKN
jgi:DNA polymerase III alpha subunit